MLNEYVPNVKCIILFLKLLKVKVNKNTVSDSLQNHPDWPSLLCISDALTKWNIPNIAGKIDIKDIKELPVPFIAYTNNRDAPLAVVTKVKDSIVELSQKNYTIMQTQSIVEFEKQWNGVYLIAESNAHSGEPNYLANKRKSVINISIPIIAFAGVVCLSLLLLKSVIINLNASKIIAVYIQYCLLLAGVVVTTLLLWYEIDKNNPMLKKVCTGIVKGNCDAILTGRASKVFSWLSWSEVGFFYFIGNLLILLFLKSPMSNTIALLAWINIGSLSYTVFSIYYQWHIAKQWCVFCLGVQALLLIGGINVVINNLFFPIPYLTSSLSSYALLFYLLPIFIWYSIKPYLLQLQEANVIKRDYLRIKFNEEVFNTLLKNQKTITISVDGLGIDLGNPNASNTLIKVCNPYCGPCANAHPKIEKLLENNANFRVKIIFATPNIESHHSYKPVSHLLAINDCSEDEKIIKQSLDDWYLAEKKDYDKFAIKYKMNGELSKQGDKIEAMDKWCKAMDIYATPTIFINGYQLPDAYEIGDLQYFLLE